MDEQTKLDVLNAARLIRDWCARVPECSTECPFIEESVECQFDLCTICGLRKIPARWKLQGDENE